MRSIGEVIFVTGLLCIAVYEDLRSYRISNRIIYTGWIGGLLFQVGRHGFHGILSWGIGSMVPIILLFILFLFKVAGAGDIKLFSIIGGMFGSKFVLSVMVAAFCLGAVLSVIQMLYFGIFLSRFQYFIQYLRKALSEKRILRYYHPERDGRDCVIHFSAAVLAAFVYCVFIVI